MPQPNSSQDDLKQTERLWREDGLALGRMLTAGRTPEAIVPWARELLELAAGEIEPPPSVRNALDVAADPLRWPEGKRAFEAVRRDTLAAQGSGDVLLEALLMLAENTSKVAFNATHPVGLFDEDTDDWIVQNVRYLADRLGGDFERSARRLVFQLLDESHR